jgi:hypothetical protein
MHGLLPIMEVLIVGFVIDYTAAEPEALALPY